MKPSSILKLIAGFGVFLIIGVIALIIISQAKPIAPPEATTDNALAVPLQIKAEIIKESDIPDNLTEEYTLYLKLSLLDKNGVKMAIPPNGMINIKLFNPNSPHKMGVMEKASDKWLCLADMENVENEAKIYLKSGFKVAELTYYLSLSIEYDDATLPKPPLLRCDIPLYKY
jgi:hypothetical protein